MSDLLSTPYIKRRRNAILRIFNKPKKVRIENEVQPSLGTKLSEAVANFFGTPAFILWLTIFCIAWIAWNTLAPDDWQFDKAELGFTALTLMLSLQASYSAPLILFAQNRQAARDRVSVEQDRSRAERNLADTEFLAREIAGIRLQLGEVATRDYVRQELKSLLEELNNQTVDDKEDK
jgi:uncharacterized membrane protein